MGDEEKDDYEDDDDEEDDDNDEDNEKFPKLTDNYRNNKKYEKNS